MLYKQDLIANWWVYNYCSTAVAHNIVTFNIDTALYVVLQVYVFGGRLRLIRNNELHCLDLDSMTWSGKWVESFSITIIMICSAGYDFWVEGLDLLHHMRANLPGTCQLVPLTMALRSSTGTQRLTFHFIGYTIINVQFWTVIQTCPVVKAEWGWKTQFFFQERCNLHKIKISKRWSNKQTTFIWHCHDLGLIDLLYYVTKRCTYHQEPALTR